MKQVELSKKELDQVYSGLILLRDRHYRNYHNAKDQTSETALAQLAIYNELEELRNRIRG